MLINIKSQRGVGLVEVLVALLVLAIGVLGFIALQYRAVEATSESTYRIQAMNLARDLAERVRVNRGALLTYETEIRTPANQATSTRNCFTTNCTVTELADFDVSQVTNRAKSVGMSVNLVACPGNSDGRNCVYIAWGDTAPLDGTVNGLGNCTTSTSYDPASTCLIMEMY
ncbi:type IV pilus modification protein PilV [Acinetobacter modestus]|uniref:Type IV pilus modification protein PilV n=1 Tax=Acinetobacter modestus TaxID=1776740 RepID=N9N7U1_9GAMM|nr:type IV pilus modification protein PilV [Acinetobacter modestus]ENW98074.1 type IV pilus modification protein PilV [Acinetobacter modestus]